MTTTDGPEARGAIAWMARNHVTANLLMIAFIAGGLVMTTQIQQEIFPDLELDFILVRVPYPGASPEEVEEGIVLAVEEEVRGIDDVEEVTSSTSSRPRTSSSTASTTPSSTSSGLAPG